MDDTLSVMGSYCSQPTEGQEDRGGREGRRDAGGKGGDTPVSLDVPRHDRFNPLTTLEMK